MKAIFSIQCQYPHQTGKYQGGIFGRKKKKSNYCFFDHPILYRYSIHHRFIENFSDKSEELQNRFINYKPLGKIIKFVLLKPLMLLDFKILDFFVKENIFLMLFVYETSKIILNIYK